MKSVTERLADKFGGEWQYDRHMARWVSMDGRVVYRMRAGWKLQEPGGKYYEITL